MRESENETEYSLETWEQAASELSDEIVRNVCADPGTYEDFYDPIGTDNYDELAQVECQVAEHIKGTVPRLAACPTKALAAALALQILTGDGPCSE